MLGRMGTPDLGQREVVGARLRFGLCLEEAAWGGGEVWGGLLCDCCCG